MTIVVALYARNDMNHIKECIVDLQKSMKDLFVLIKNGEINNPRNLNGPILMQRVDTHMNIACKYLERFTGNN